MNKVIKLLLVLVLCFSLLPATVLAAEGASGETAPVVENDAAALAPNHDLGSVIFGEAIVTNGVAIKSFEVELYAGEEKLATTVLNNVNGFLDADDVYKLSWHILIQGKVDSYWTTTWTGMNPIISAAPTHVVTYINGVNVGQTAVQYNYDGGAIVTDWASMPGVKAAQIGDTYYSSLQAAVDAATAGQTVTLLGDVAEAMVNVAAGDDLVIDLNGKTLTGAIYSEGVLTVKNGTIVNTNFKSCIESNGAAAKLTVENVTATSNRHALRLDGGVALILSGSYTSNGTGTVQAVNAGNSTGSPATTVTIKGGTFRASVNDNESALSLQSGVTATVEGGTFYSTGKGCVNMYGGSIEVLGGEFFAEGEKTKNFNLEGQDAIVLKGGSFNNNTPLAHGETLENYISDDYHVVESEGTWTVKMIAPVAAIGETEYASLAEAIAAVGTEPATIKLYDGEHVLPSISSKEITFTGSKNAVINMAKAVTASGSTITFDGVTLAYGDNAQYVGLHHSAKEAYKNCTINGQMFLYAPTAVFENCEFTNKASYNVWTYGAKNVTFTDCSFATGGRAILVYNEVKTDSFVANVTLTNCAFTDDGTYAGAKAAVETGVVDLLEDNVTAVNGPTSNKYNLVFTNCTVEGFEANKSTSALWGNKNAMDDEHLNVTIDGKTVYPAPAQITAQPGDVYTTATGERVSISVTAEGKGLKYQWEYKTSAEGEWKNAAANGNKTATLKVPATASRDGYVYRCVITDAYNNEVISEEVLFSVLSVETNPVSKEVELGENAVFTAAASGQNLKYQWEYKTSAEGEWKKATASGNKTAELTVPGTKSRDGYIYRCAITDAAGNTVYTTEAKLDVLVIVLTINTQPTTQKVIAGTTAEFTVAATGKNPTYQWEYKTSADDEWKNATATGNKTATLKVPGTISRTSYYYRCVITDAYGETVTTKAVRLYVLGIKTQPTSVTAAKGSAVKFTVVATGAGRTYQWEYRTEGGEWKNATATGNKSATISMTATAARNGNEYRCRIFDNAGNEIVSRVVTLKLK